MSKPVIKDLKQLLVFKAIYAKRNLSKVAEELDMTQPAISSILKKLRETLNDPLFVRKGNTLRPTPKANVIIDPVCKAIAELDTALQIPEFFDPTVDAAHFRFILADPLEEIVLPYLLSLIGQNSKVTLELLPPQLHKVDDAVLSGAAQIAVLNQPLGRTENLKCEPLFPTDLVAVVRKDHPDLIKDNDPNFLYRQNFASLNMSTAYMKNSNTLLFWQRLNINITCFLPRLGSVAELVSRTNLAGILPRFQAEHIANRLNLDIIELPVKMGEQQVFLIWNIADEKRADQAWLRTQIQLACSSIP